MHIIAATAGIHSVLPVLPLYGFPPSREQQPRGNLRSAGYVGGQLIYNLLIILYFLNHDSSR